MWELFRELLLEIILGITVIIAALTFIYGVFAWKREYIGRRKIEISEKMLSQFYEVQEAIRDSDSSTKCNSDFLRIP